MERIVIEGTPKTPTISFDMVSGKLEIRGRSIPENSIEFYKPLVEHLEQYAGKPQSATNVLDVFKKLEAIHKGGSATIINWYYEQDDEDMLEAGEDYQAIISVPFKMIEVAE
jgi:hypothetical protein